MLNLCWLASFDLILCLLLLRFDQSILVFAAFVLNFISVGLEYTATGYIHIFDERHISHWLCLFARIRAYALVLLLSNVCVCIDVCIWCLRTLYLFPLPNRYRHRHRHYTLIDTNIHRGRDTFSIGVSLYASVWVPHSHYLGCVFVHAMLRYSNFASQCFSICHCTRLIKANMKIDKILCIHCTVYCVHHTL